MDPAKICHPARVFAIGEYRERAEKEAFYEGQGSTGVAFMRMALTTLAVLNKLSAHPVIKQSFLQPPLVGSAAFNCLHFLELLVSLPLAFCRVGPTCATSKQQGNAARVLLHIHTCTVLQCFLPFPPVLLLLLVIIA